MSLIRPLHTALGVSVSAVLVHHCFLACLRTSPLIAAPSMLHPRSVPLQLCLYYSYYSMYLLLLSSHTHRMTLELLSARTIKVHDMVRVSCMNTCIKHEHTKDTHTLDTHTRTHWCMQERTINVDGAKAEELHVLVLR